MIIYTDMSFHNQLYEDFNSINFEGKNQNNLSNNEMKVSFYYFKNIYFFYLISIFN